jgi:hypothetical protein
MLSVTADRSVVLLRIKGRHMGSAVVTCDAAGRCRRVSTESADRPHQATRRGRDERHRWNQTTSSSVRSLLGTGTDGRARAMSESVEKVFLILCTITEVKSEPTPAIPMLRAAARTSAAVLAMCWWRLPSQRNVAVGARVEDCLMLRIDVLADHLV